MNTHQNMDVVAGLEPAEVWRYFAEISSIPRPSKKEGAVRAYVRSVAERHGFAVREDAVGNLLIEVPASPGREDAPVTVLQGHLDMVCEKNSGTEHDFEHDPIRLRLEGTGEAQIVRAEGTTLGADNGIGVSLALAAATSGDLEHGPLEILCTIDEEAGMTGASALEPSFLQGRWLLNLDSEEDDHLYIGCAGGADTTLAWSLPLRPLDEESGAVRICVTGLRGGHSGGDIHENRPSAIQVLLRVLEGAGEGLRLLDLDGGSKRNAIAREARAVVAGPVEDIGRLEEAARVVRRQTVDEEGERSCAIEVEPELRSSDRGRSALGAEDSARLLSAIRALPHGVLSVVPEIPGLIRTSNNVATIRMNIGEDARIVVGCLTRSSSEFDLDQALVRLAAIGGLAGAEVESGNRYPGWQPDVDSALLARTRAAYVRVFGDEPVVTAIHAGLECGVLGSRIGGIDMVSLGPSIWGAHSPDERVSTASVGRFYRLLRTLLEDLAQG